jgi:ubiquinone/menaquinone biosynthesis C-methylase UbiE
MSDTQAADPVAALKDKHRAIWTAGDYPSIAELVTGVGASLVEAAGIEPGMDVLDVATGPGNAAIRAATRGAKVTGIDLTPSLIEDAKRRAADAGLEIDFKVGDAEDLPVADESFDVVLSAIGVQFAPRSEVVVSELVRVTRSGGTILLGNWTRDGVIGRLFSLIGEYQPAPPEWVTTPPKWGDEDLVRSLFASHGIDVTFERKHAIMPHNSVEEYMVQFETEYGPSIVLRKALEEQGRYAEYRERWGKMLEEFVQTPGGGDIRQDYYVIRGVKP